MPNKRNMLVDVSQGVPLALLVLRAVTGIVFFSSGKSDLQKPEERGKSLGFSSGATRLLGAMEVIAAISIVLGIFAQVGAAIIMVVTLGAMHRKIFVWHKHFYEKEAYGWHYDLLFFAIAFVILCTGGGSWVIL
ncbi:MAG: DoxX family protein [Flavobacteriales bacterium]|nr:DoxX family protein [Flavobacteriales bacterium]